MDKTKGTAAPKSKLTTSSSPKATGRRRQLFIERYLINGNNATDAAKFAGYSPQSAAMQGSRLLQHPDVVTLLGNRAEEVVAKALLSTERWAAEMAAIGHFDPAELYDEAGKLIPLRNLPEHVRRAIASVKIERRFEGKGENRVEIVTEEVRPNDKNTALNNIGKHLGVYERDNQQRSTPIQIAIQLVG